MITLIDYGMGNLGSVANMLRRNKIAYRITADPREIEVAEKLILPGVGSFDVGVAKLRQSGIWTAIRTAVEERGAKFLGICLGMQLMARGSEEGCHEGLAWIDTVAVKFRFEKGEKDGRFVLRVPHMAWRDVRVTRTSELMAGIDSPRFYFVHSYYLPAQMPETVAEATHGIEFTAAVERGRVAGAQFHPEKSHSYGLKVLTNYLRL